MKFSGIGTRTIGSAKLYIGNNGPTIMTAAGVGGFIATTALAIHATLKAEKAVPYIRENIRDAKQSGDDSDEGKKVRARNLAKAYGENSLTLGKIYWPTFVTGSLSIVCVISAHRVLIKRNASLVAAYTAIDAAYRSYRSRVREEIGEEKELLLYRGVKTRPRAEGDEGFDPDAACEIVDMDDVMPSTYSRFFDEYSQNWSKTPEYNLMFLRTQQQWANDRLVAYGHIFLNEVYDALGLKRSQAGQIVGWKLDGNGDGHVDFGIYSIGDESSRAFVNGHEASILLDFNVDGPIRI